MKCVHVGLRQFLCTYMYIPIAMPKFPKHKFMQCFLELMHTFDLYMYTLHLVYIINPQCTSTARVIVVGFVCVFVCLLKPHLTSRSSFRPENTVTIQYTCSVRLAEPRLLAEACIQGQQIYTPRVCTLVLYMCSIHKQAQVNWGLRSLSDSDSDRDSIECQLCCRDLSEYSKLATCVVQHCMS